MSAIGGTTESAEARIRALGIELPPAPTPLGAYVAAVQTGALLFVSGMLPIRNGEPLVTGRLGAEIDTERARVAARAAALNALAVARAHLGSLDRVTKLVRLGVSIATAGDVRDHPRVADAASELFRDVLGADKLSTRLVFGIASLPLGMPVELEVIFEVAPNAS